MSDMEKSSPTLDTSEQLTLREVKRRLTDLKIEALRRGYGLGPEPAGALDSIDAVVGEAARSIAERRREREDCRNQTGQDPDEVHGVAGPQADESYPAPARP